MKQLEQGSFDWLEWRKRGIGASEVPVLMGNYEYQTPTDVWKIKLGITKEQESNWAMQRGIEDEPKIRAMYELYNDRDMPPTLMEHSQITILRASLDGWNDEIKRVLEIKRPGAEKHRQAKEDGRVPDCYMAQVQAQLAVSGGESADYVSFDGEAIAVVNVKPDREYHQKIIQAVLEFWHYVETKTPPPLTDWDYKDITNEDALSSFLLFKDMKTSGAKDKELAKVKEIIIPFIDHPRVRCEGVRVIRNQRGAYVFSLEKIQ